MDINTDNLHSLYDIIISVLCATGTMFFLKSYTANGKLLEPGEGDGTPRFRHYEN